MHSRDIDCLEIVIEVLIQGPKYLLVPVPAAVIYTISISNAINSITTIVFTYVYTYCHVEIVGMLLHILYKAINSQSCLADGPLAGRGTRK